MISIPFILSSLLDKFFYFCYFISCYLISLNFHNIFYAYFFIMLLKPDIGVNPIMSRVTGWVE
jgi:hypothetical protein